MLFQFYYLQKDLFNLIFFKLKMQINESNTKNIVKEFNNFIKI